MKNKYIALINKAIAWSEKARREGLLALEDALEDALKEQKSKDRDLFLHGMRFVIDGTDAAIIEKVLDNIMKANKSDLKYKLMQKEAVLSIQCGNNSRLLFELMASYLTEKEYKILKSLEVLKD